MRLVQRRVIALVLIGSLVLSACGGGSASAPNSAVGTAASSLQISADPSALAVPAGGNGSFLLNVSPSTSIPVAVNLGNAPSGITLTAGTTTASSGQQSEQLMVDGTLAPGTYALNLDATSGSETATTTLSLLVNPALPASLLQVEQQTFQYFWNTTNPVNGLAPDHWPGASYASIAATGFALSAYPIGVQNGWVTRAQAAQRVLTTLQFLASLPQGSASSGDAGDHGFFYHFLDINTGVRYGASEISSVDTALLMAGVLFDASYFDQANSTELQIRTLANQLFDDVDWPWMTQADPPLINLAWTPETGFSPYNWQGYNEAMILYIEAMGSPTYPVSADAWNAWASTYPAFWGTYYGRQYLSFGPLFGFQYSQAWIDFRGIQDVWMRAQGIDYFINSRRAAEAQQSYAIADPMGWTGYGADLWGLTACDGPGNFTLTSATGQVRTFKGYYARGAGRQDSFDDGTVAPTAALGSIAFAPAIVIPTMESMLSTYGAYIQGQYGLFDAFNPSFTYAGVTPDSGSVVPGEGWFDSEYLGIDQGPILMMLENYRSGLEWSVMRGNSVIVDGLQRAGFTGGWLAGTPDLQ